MGKERYNLYLNSCQTSRTSYFTATITTTVLSITVAATYGSFPIYCEIAGGPYTVLPGTFITSYGTGDSTGKIGTYNLSTTQTGASSASYYGVATGLGSQVYDNSRGKNYYSYYINWDAMLPRNYEKYNVYFSFNSLSTSTSIIFPNSVALLDIDFGGFNSNEPNGVNSHSLGVITYGQMIGTSNYRYQANSVDNNPTTIKYPSNSVITVGLSELNTMNSFGSPLSFASGSLNVGNYILILSFEPVD